LQVRQVNFNTRTIVLHRGTTKNEEGREVVILGRVQELLERSARASVPSSRC